MICTGISRLLSIAQRYMLPVGVKIIAWLTQNPACLARNACPSNNVCPAGSS